MILVAENKHRELHNTYLCTNPKIAIVANKYKNDKLVATFKAGLLRRATNYYTVDIHKDNLNFDFSHSDNYDAPSIDSLQYDQQTLKFIHLFAKKILRNTLIPYLPSVIEFIKNLDVENKLILNHSCCQYLLGILLNHIKFTNIKILCDLPKPFYSLSKYSPSKKFCFGLYNKKKHIYDKTTSILVCVYCYSVVNIAFKSKTENVNASVDELDTGNVNVEYKTFEIDSSDDDEPCLKKQKRCPEEIKSNVKRNIVKTKTYTDNINPTITLFCREKHRKVHVLRLLNYSSFGTFIKRQIIWGINKTTAYWIELSNDFSTINILHHKKKHFHWFVS